MTTAPTSFDDKVREFNRAAAHKLYEGGEEAILEQMRLHGEIVAGLTEEINRFRNAHALINAALSRSDVIEAFRNPERVVVSVRKEDDPKSFPIGDYASHDSDLDAVLSDGLLPSLFAWCVSVALGEDVVTEMENEK